MEEKLRKIRDFADKAHGMQMRKYTPERYIVHPERVMNLLRPRTGDIALLAAALLHDVLEDTPTTGEQILDFLKTLMPEALAKRTLALVIELTDVYVKEDYPGWNRKKRKSAEMERLITTSPESQTIKYADIIDNCREIVKYDRNFAHVFLRECMSNLRKLDKGDPLLYQEALELVRSEMGKLR
jgi:(p)ppGpp synthase/HD superfamily hydrolase